MSNQRNTPSQSKVWLWIVLVLASLILLLNGWLSQQGEPLPARLTDYAKDVVATSLAELDSSSQTAIPAASTPSEATATPQPTYVPSPTSYAEGVADADTEMWSESDTAFDYYVLALCWQPAFCETQPQKEECVTQHAQRYDAQNFALHGLWPSLANDPQHTFNYCDVPRAVVAQDSVDWCDLPALPLSAEVWDDLTVIMPGTASCLQNHEWYKHGTCAGMSAEAYFALSHHLTALFSQTAFDDYVADHAGETVQRSALLDRFAQEFGSDHVDCLTLRCDRVEGTSLLTEIQLTLRPDIASPAAFSELFPVEDIRPDGNCPAEFRIDVVGLGNF
jgi:ribonuclease T2